jgi:hypothetical protein
VLQNLEGLAAFERPETKSERAQSATAVEQKARPLLSSKQMIDSRTKLEQPDTVEQTTPHADRAHLALQRTECSAASAEVPTQYTTHRRTF